jgi:glutamate dehydrogenase
MEVETGSTVAEIIRAHTIASDSFETNTLEELIESLDFKLPMVEQFDMFRFLRRLLNLATRWFLNSQYHKKDLQKSIVHFNQNIKQIKELIPELMSGMTKKYLEALIEQFARHNLPQSIAEKIGAYRAIYTVLNIIEVAFTNKLNLEKTAKIYFAIGERMKLVWFRDELANDTREDYWCALTRLTLRDELDILQRALTLAVAKVDEAEPNIGELIEKWAHNNPRIVARWDDFLSQLHRSSTVEYSMFFIAIHELTGLLASGRY